MVTAFIFQAFALFGMEVIGLVLWSSVSQFDKADQYERLHARHESKRTILLRNTFVFAVVLLFVKFHRNCYPLRGALTTGLTWETCSIGCWCVGDLLFRIFAFQPGPVWAASWVYGEYLIQIVVLSVAIGIAVCSCQNVDEFGSVASPLVV